ncbi:MAG: hypothetical protein AAGA68_18985 [Pseudomonadota bacterium]
MDLGCGFTKAVTEARSDVFKSVVGMASERPLSNDLALSDASDRHREFSLVDSGRRYYLGELAERESDRPKATLEADEFFDEYAPSLAPVSLALASRPRRGAAGRGRRFAYSAAH